MISIENQLEKLYRTINGIEVNNPPLGRSKEWLLKEMETILNTNITNGRVSSEKNLQTLYQRITGSRYTGNPLFLLSDLLSQVELNTELTVSGVAFDESDYSVFIGLGDRIQVPIGRLDETQGWFAIRTRMGFSPSAELGRTAPVFFNWGTTTNRVIVYYLESDNSFRAQRQSGGTGVASGAQTPSFNVDDIITLVAAWTATQVKLSINGGNFVAAANTSIPTISDTSFDIGGQGTAVANRQIESDVLYAAAGTGTLSDSEATSIHQKLQGNRQNLVLGDFPGSPFFLWLPDDINALIV